MPVLNKCKKKKKKKKEKEKGIPVSLLRKKAIQM
jgi:hypothetical protein